MTYEEAKRYILENWFDGDQDVKAVVDGDKETMTMKMAVEAIEKQIPKQPVEEATMCPNCGGNIINEADNDYNFNYCHYCGQKLDWNE